jgi:hypothetical protein
MSGWIGVDLDGTLAEYTGWQGAAHIGKPVADMVARVKQWIAAGHTVKIFTARVSFPKDVPLIGKSKEVVEAAGRKLEADLAREAIKLWCVEHIGFELPITNEKDYGMIELWDDRCVQVEPNTGRPIGKSTRGL